MSAREYAAEAVVWSRLAGLLSAPGDREEVRTCWDIGEQEAGLEVLVDRLLGQGTGVEESARAELAVMAEQWGEWDWLGARIAALPGAGEEAGRLRVVPDGAEETRPAGFVLPGHPLAATVLVPWIACAPCGRVLARSHRREEWGALSFLAEGYVVFGPERAPAVFPRDMPGACWAALDALRDGDDCP
ncbi:hypothetical protein AB0I06_14460 [Streptomyces sp. NPDC050674]|uniref:hypothetical protein n=1 Tax=Streptomyces sp. NPDC050674 TaxID=3157216 RepID=UPI0034299C57